MKRLPVSRQVFGCAAPSARFPEGNLAPEASEAAARVLVQVKEEYQLTLVVVGRSSQQQPIFLSACDVLQTIQHLESSTRLIGDFAISTNLFLWVN